MSSSMSYRSSKNYIASPELQAIVNVAIDLQRPLLIKGEPGTGKTLLAKSIAESMNLPFYSWQVKSTSKAQDGLYTYDAVQRLNDSRFHEKDISNIQQYIKLGALGQAFKHGRASVVLIDEIDKADPEFPNDLLHEIDEMSFDIYETGERVKALVRPIVIITSNNDKELPDAFLRRCVFHYLEFPSFEIMEQIIQVHLPDVERKLLHLCMEKFYHLRNEVQLRKKPSTSELVDWVNALVKAGIDIKNLKQDFPFLGVLIKNEVDMQVLQK